MSVVGNKSDLDDQRMVSRDRGEDLAHSLGGMFTESSAINNTGTHKIVLIMKEMKEQLSAEPSQIISIDLSLFYTCKHLKCFGSCKIEQLYSQQVVKVLFAEVLNNVSLYSLTS